jgi:hypothetical protein
MRSVNAVAEDVSLWVGSPQSKMLWILADMDYFSKSGLVQQEIYEHAMGYPDMSKILLERSCE